MIPDAAARRNLRGSPMWRASRRTREVAMMFIDSLTIAGLLAFVSISAFLLLTSRHPAEDKRRHCRFDTCGRPVRD